MAPPPVCTSLLPLAPPMDMAGCVGIRRRGLPETFPFISSFPHPSLPLSPHHLITSDRSIPLPPTIDYHHYDAIIHHPRHPPRRFCWPVPVGGLARRQTSKQPIDRLGPRSEMPLAPRWRCRRDRRADHQWYSVGHDGLCPSCRMGYFPRVRQCDPHGYQLCHGRGDYPGQQWSAQGMPPLALRVSFSFAC